jgi:hypothetical protein
MIAAATMSRRPRCRFVETPLADIARPAVFDDSRSSAKVTGRASSRPRRVAVSRTTAACAPSVPSIPTGNPTTRPATSYSSASSRNGAISRARRLPSSTATGDAMVPSGSDTATPTRASPISRPRSRMGVTPRRGRGEPLQARRRSRLSRLHPPVPWRASHRLGRR